MPISPSTPRLRLGLVFFSDSDTALAHDLVDELATDLLPWHVVERGPLDALLMSRGARGADDENLAVLRLSADADAQARKLYGDSMPPIALRKPLRPDHLKIVLEMAAATLIPEHVASLSPQTRPRVKNVGSAISGV